ncbi:3-deoxy-manno-octulosonate cytidylyltransferase [Gammaproteobacteria bacterium]|nr:3-deoxy-manno-octulosonate cytidylyltransferase [Gammaproteobacteria bacterium]MDA7844131.1 3-deoxy-manno-octulosonate cytidylyltransferase [Gammaproteobacteria bacterium]MDA9102216.1 3-deoxy-manno-octulosonate cytidylyltransferase [Gammaproteobacteria bacterium]
MTKDFIILIPSRIGSTRLKNKPLVDIDGKTLIQRVFEQSLKATSQSFIATDSQLIYEHAKSFTDNIVMTSDTHISGTDRVFEAASSLSLNEDQLIINLQGDEPFMPVDLINTLVDDYTNNECDVITASHPIESNQDIVNPNCVKVLSESSYATDFMRIPSNEPLELLSRHIGIYGYSFETLKKLVDLEPSEREINLKLEQLRFLDNKYSIYVSQYRKIIQSGIDTSDDVDAAVLYLNDQC